MLAMTHSLEKYSMRWKEASLEYLVFGDPLEYDENEHIVLTMDLVIRGFQGPERVLRFRRRAE
eukprot:6180832-Pyramimonas_sp.AAC.1